MWYDEYDNGAGSSLATPLEQNSSTLLLANGTGNKFNVNDIIWVFGKNDQEAMQILNVSGDTLQVQRGVQGSTPALHYTFAKVFTESQVIEGIGWLGQPLGPASIANPSFLDPMNLLQSGSFDTPGQLWWQGWQWMVTTGDATIQQDNSTFVNGNASARIDIISFGINWGINLQQYISVESGVNYTVSFWAKSPNHIIIDAVISQTISPWSIHIDESLFLGPQWQYYTFSWIAVADEEISLEFAFGYPIGSIWIDEVKVKSFYLLS